MELITKRRMIRSDTSEILLLLELTKKRYGTFSENRLNDFFNKGKIFGVFINGNICGAAFRSLYLCGCLTDNAVLGIANIGEDVCYLRMADKVPISIAEQLADCVCNDHSGQPSIWISIYDGKIEAPYLFNRGFELAALKGGVGIKPNCIFTHSIKQKRYCIHHTSCDLTDSKTIGKLLYEGYRGIDVNNGRLLLYI